MIEFKLGKTGSGKSYLCVKEIIDFLRDTNAYINTNLPLDLGELNAYMARKYSELGVDVIGRVRILDAAETAEFYLHRERGNDLEPVTKAQEKLLQYPDFEGAAQKSGRPVVYVIDEAHIHFDAREWAKVGLTLNYFASQHEKFSTHIIFVTQFLKQVELRLREHATQFTECTNHALRNILVFKQPSYFTANVTYKAPPCPPESTTRYTLDRDIAKCYRTTGGVGVAGQLSGRFYKKRKGLPIWTAPIVILLIITALVYGPSWLIKKGTETALGAAEVAPVVNAPVRQQEEPVPTNTRQAVDTEDKTPAKGVVPEGVYLTGAIRRGTRFVLVLSDGTVRTDRDNWDEPRRVVESVSRTFADIRGQRYYYQPRKVRQGETGEGGGGHEVAAPTPTAPTATKSGS